MNQWIAFGLAGRLLLVGATAAAQVLPPVIEAPPPVPEYRVEILIFANRDFNPNEERFDHELARSSPAARVSEAFPAFDVSSFDLPPPAALPDDETVDELPAANREFRFRRLAAEELELNTEYRRLENLGAYEPLVHAGWVQPGLPEEESRPVDLSWIGASNPIGTIRVHLSRFLHISLDLTYRGSDSQPVSGNFGDQLSELAIAPRYRLTASRQARSGELHYFDHPAFGVLVKVTPVPTASPANKPAA